MQMETDATEIRPRTVQLMEEVRRMPLFRQLVPQEAAIGWPIPLRLNGRVYITLLFHGYSRRKDQGGASLYAPFSTLTLDWQNGKPVEYTDLRFRAPWPATPPETPVGAFPHPAVQALSVGEYRQQREQLLYRFDQLFEMLARQEVIPDAWSAEFGTLLRQMMEPALEPYYRALAPRFFERFLGKPAA